MVGFVIGFCAGALVGFVFAALCVAEGDRGDD